MQSYNPSTLSQLTRSPSVSGSDISSLINGASANLNNAFAQIENFGKAKNSAAVAKLLGSGELNNLDSQQTANVIAKITGGGPVNPETAKTVQDLISNKAKSEQQTQSDTSALKRLTEQNNATAAEGYWNREAQKDVAKIYANKELLEQRQNHAMQMLEAKYAAKGQSELSKVGVKQIEADIASGKIPLDKQTGEVESYISDKMDIFFDRELDPKAERMVRSQISKFLSTPQGQATYAIGGPSETWNIIKGFMDSKNLKFEDKFDWKKILPGGQSPWRRELKE